jgi:aryl-alcohol dehydrogenase-like predicted oxidoreductase
MARNTPKKTEGTAAIVDGQATRAGTARYRDRFSTEFVADHFRDTSFEGYMSSIGIGTYLGDSTDEDDASYIAAIQHAVGSGINVIDTALNYRAQRSERSVGTAIRRAIESGVIQRDEIVVCSKAGYVPLDGTPPATREEYRQYVEREFLDKEIVLREELVGGGHSLAPRFLRFCLAKSRQNLGLRTIDTYYLHNPEQQARAVDRETLYSRIEAAFSMLEEAAERGDIGVYGCATWNALRTPRDSVEHLSLDRLVAIAHGIAGDTHHFRVIQLPINLAMPEAIRQHTQTIDGNQASTVEAAQASGLTVVASATLLQATLATGLPPEIGQQYPDASDAQRAIRFVRSIPEVTTALIGMRSTAHVDENLGAARASSPQ